MCALWCVHYIDLEICSRSELRKTWSLRQHSNGEGLCITACVWKCLSGYLRHSILHKNTTHTVQIVHISLLLQSSFKLNQIKAAILRARNLSAENNCIKKQLGLINKSLKYLIPHNDSHFYISIFIFIWPQRHDNFTYKLLLSCSNTSNI